MTPFDRRVRTEVYSRLLATGHPPDAAALAEALGAAEGEVQASLRRLADLHALVLAPDSTNVWMAHPFSARPTAFPVVHDGRRYYANCAWDAAGVLVIVDGGGTTTACADECGAVLGFSLDSGVFEGYGVVHFAVPARRFWDDIAFT